MRPLHLPLGELPLTSESGFSNEPRTECLTLGISVKYVFLHFSWFFVLKDSYVQNRLIHRLNSHIADDIFWPFEVLPDDNTSDPFHRTDATKVPCFRKTRSIRGLFWELKWLIFRDFLYYSILQSRLDSKLTKLLGPIVMRSLWSNYNKRGLNLFFRIGYRNRPRL